jgi:hypothetical protein
MLEVSAARATFRPLMNPAGANERAIQMFRDNVGYNVSPISDFINYETIGKIHTYITDKSAITKFRDLNVNAEISVGLLNGNNKISFFHATKIALNLGLISPY